MTMSWDISGCQNREVLLTSHFTLSVFLKLRITGLVAFSGAETVEGEIVYVHIVHIKSL
jgi:hypothetical protein